MTTANPFGLSPTDLAHIRSLLKDHDKVQSAVIFGSRAMGTFRPGSDIDIAISAPDLDHESFLRLSTALDDLMLPYKIDLVCLHEIDNHALLEHIKRLGVALF